MTQIECIDLCLGYEGRVVTEGLNFSVNEGDYLCIVGENGSGKTTLMRALLRQKSPLSGEIRFGGLLPTEIGYLPQQTQSQTCFPASVFEVVISGCLSSMKNRFFYTKAEKARATENMEKLGIKDIAKAPFCSLSGGQKQRVLLARALTATHKMLLLDEPTASLDPLVSGDFYDLVERLNREEKISVVMISHDIHAAMKYATHILHIGKKPLFFGTTHDYIHSGISGCFCSHDHTHGGEKND